MLENIVPVILCGGSGTRLWPLSRELAPKQFVVGMAGESLFAATARRAMQLPNAGSRKAIVVCNEEHRFYVTAALRELDNAQADILLEPAARNTAAAVALAAFHLVAQNGDGLMFVMPSDHEISDFPACSEAIGHAAALAAKGKIVTFGIVPHSPETGYGYIEQGGPLGDGCLAVSRFVEKPDADRARAMLAQGGFYWNSGMFVLAASTYLAELERFAPAIHAACRKAMQGCGVDGPFIRPDRDAFLTSPAISMDYAVMEHTGLAAMTPLPSGWSDLGSWEALYAAARPGEADGMACSGDVLNLGSRNCYVNAQNRLVATVGLEDTIVVETRDAVLVAARGQSQKVGEVVRALRAEDRAECRQHPLVQRPWGSYETLARGTRFQVKRIVVNPGAELSLQLHHHRAEHWVVVSGTAEVTNGDDVSIYTENQSAYIPVGARHRLRNPGVIPLVLIEIQSGAYLGEDDIVRLEDAYGRVTG